MNIFLNSFTYIKVLKNMTLKNWKRNIKKQVPDMKKSSLNKQFW